MAAALVLGRQRNGATERGMGRAAAALQLRPAHGTHDDAQDAQCNHQYAHEQVSTNVSVEECRRGSSSSEPH